uniref:ATP-binding protein n=1 Tax=Gemmatimonas sp. TaxID=1962908 RepID=UPI003F71509B
MLLEQTLATLHALKLHGMATALDEQRGIPDLTTLAFEERLALLLEREQARRHDRRVARLLQLARLRYAYSGGIRPLIPVKSGHPFRRIPATR